MVGPCISSVLAEAIMVEDTEAESDAGRPLTGESGFWASSLPLHEQGPDPWIPYASLGPVSK